MNGTGFADKIPLHIALENLLEASRSHGNGYAALKGMIILLLENGADATKGNTVIGHDRSCLHWAVVEGHVKALELLINHSFGTRRYQLINCQVRSGRGRN